MKDPDPQHSLWWVKLKNYTTIGPERVKDWSSRSFWKRFCLLHIENFSIETIMIAYTKKHQHTIPFLSTFPQHMISATCSRPISVGRVPGPYWKPLSAQPPWSLIWRNNRTPYHVLPPSLRTWQVERVSGPSSVGRVPGLFRKTPPPIPSWSIIWRYNRTPSHSLPPSLRTWQAGPFGKTFPSKRSWSLIRRNNSTFFHPPFAHDKWDVFQAHFGGTCSGPISKNSSNEATMIAYKKQQQNTLPPHMTRGTCSGPISVGHTQGPFQKTIPSKPSLPPSLRTWQVGRLRKRVEGRPLEGLWIMFLDLSWAPGASFGAFPGTCWRSLDICKHTYKISSAPSKAFGSCFWTFPGPLRPPRGPRL